MQNSLKFFILTPLIKQINVNKDVKDIKIKEILSKPKFNWHWNIWKVYKYVILAISKFFAYILNISNKLINVLIIDKTKIVLEFFLGTNKRANAVKRGKKIKIAKVNLVLFRNVVNKVNLILGKIQIFHTNLSKKKIIIIKMFST